MKVAELLVQLVIGLMVGFCWLGGIVIAKGALSTGFAICIPPYAWYLVVEKVMIVQGWI